MNNQSVAEVDLLKDSNMAQEQTEDRHLSQTRAYPFLKWAGGKRAVIHEIARVLPDTFNTYYEPFLGGGAVFFGLDGCIREAYLSDLNAELMLTYRMLQKSPAALIEQLKEHRKKHSAKYYSRVREKGHVEQDPIKVAARFIYLNKTCYNGLYRVNRAGKFNVPMGSYKNPKIYDEDNLYAVSEVLQKATLRFHSFTKIQPGAGDLVYCDPPYDETFTAYTNGRFVSSDQIALKNACDGWRAKGAHVIVSSSDTELIRKTWQGYRITEITAPRNISCKGDGRNRVTELLIIGE